MGGFGQARDWKVHWDEEGAVIAAAGAMQGALGSSYILIVNTDLFGGHNLSAAESPRFPLRSPCVLQPRVTLSRLPVTPLCNDTWARCGCHLPRVRAQVSCQPAAARSWASTPSATLQTWTQRLTMMNQTTLRRGTPGTCA